MVWLYLLSVFILIALFHRYVLNSFTDKEKKECDTGIIVAHLAIVFWPVSLCMLIIGSLFSFLVGIGVR